MVFSSLTFVLTFLPLTLIFYYLVPRPYKNTVLFIASLVFYAWGEPVYIFIMIFSTVFDYLNGLVIEKNRDHEIIPKAVLIISIIVNLGILGFFKYYDFIVNNINLIFDLELSSLNLPLPLGISFYTFQTMSYTIDVYLGKVTAQKNIITFGTYVTMFPQLVAGPIVKYGDIERQLTHRRESLDNFGEGVETFLIGLAKKLLIANNIGLLWDGVKSMPIQELSVLTAWLGITAFSFQIYFDFSGYSDMAIGLGKMFGFSLLKNFDYPYISRSITEFWRRWHISLGSWFREYVYIPLGGNRRGRLIQYRNLVVVWFLTGLWHGANWNFILWGMYFGAFIILEKMFLGNVMENCSKVLCHFYTMLVVIIGWVFFECDSFGQTAGFLKTMFGLNGAKLFNPQGIYYLYTNAVLFVLAVLFSTPLPHNVIKKVREKRQLAFCTIMPLIYLFIMFLSVAYMVNESYNPFLYFRF